MNFGFIYFITFTIAAVSSQTSTPSPITVCDPSVYQQCLRRLGSTQYSCSDDRAITADTTCVLDQLESCREQFGDVHVSTVRPYVRLLENIYQKCQGDYELGDCDLSTAKSCTAEFFNILATGGVAKLCKQSSVTLNCLQPSLAKCTDLSRYSVAMLADEVKLTSDLLCHPSTCNIDIAGQLLKEGLLMIDYPISIVRQSSLICGELQTTLALVTNQTAECSQSDIPPSLWQNYWLLYRFGSSYCEPKGDNFMLANVPQELLLTVYLATVGTNKWTSSQQMCSLFNETLRQAANHSKVTTVYNENLFTWRFAMETNLDRYSSECLSSDMYDCDWTLISASSGICDFEAAEQCVDLVLLSKLIVEVNLQRTTWQTVCTAADNMLACYQNHLDGCMFGSVPYSEVVQEVGRLVMYECNQLGMYDRPDRCDAPILDCDVGKSFMFCKELADSKDDICRHKEELRECFHKYTAGCGSIQMEPSQFNLEWLLGDCNHNISLVPEDSMSYIVPCRLQYGYNIYNGFSMSSDFRWIMCTAMSLYEQCLEEKMIPALASFYKSQFSDFYMQYYTTMCNTTRLSMGALPQGLTEPPQCQIKTVAFEFTRNLLLLSDAPYLPVVDYNHRCQFFIPGWLGTLQYKMLGCSMQRQTVMNDMVIFQTNMYTEYCSAVPQIYNNFNLCDMTKVQTCIEELGSYTYLEPAGADYCGKLEETYNCMYQYGRQCDETTQDNLLQEVRAIRGLMSGLSCGEPAWCDPASSNVTIEWITTACAPLETCQMNGWRSCIDQFGVNQFCGMAPSVVSCIQDQLSGCDPVQYIVAQYDMQQYVSSVEQQFQSTCGFSLLDPPTVTQTHYDLRQCFFMPFMTQNIPYDQAGICSAIRGYSQCLGNIDRQSLPYVWRAVLNNNVQRWTKETYLGCELSNDGFVVNPDFDRDEFTGNQCQFDGFSCLRSLLETSVAISPILPMLQRKATVCDGTESNYQCVVDTTSGCQGNQRSLLVMARWLKEAGDNLGVCASGWKTERTCNPAEAMECMTDLGLLMAGDISTQSKTQVCMKVLSVQDCVNEQTSSCDFYTRTKVERTYSQVWTLVSHFCTAPPITSMDLCTAGQLGSMCDVERALVCFVPTQALLLQQSSSLEEICGTIPALKFCVQQFSSGCDEGTRTMLTKRQLRLSARLEHQCPQMFCEECQARACIKNLYQTLQYQDVHICSAISETQQCIEENARYCDAGVGQALLQELDLLVGEDRRMCEVTLPSCLHKLTQTAYEIMSYDPSTGMSSQGYDAQNQTAAGAMYSYQRDLSNLCDEANVAYYCVEHHLQTLEPRRQQVLLQTLRGMGDIVYDKCQGAQLQCYSCANATSNEDCNQQAPQTCAPNMQACGTIVTSNSYLSKGCVKPDVCRSGCYGNTCSYCCQGDFCNQPWNNVLIEPPTCQPLSALWCGFQLLSVATQNTTNQTCSVLRDSIQCMMSNTHTCQSHRTMAMGVLARELLAGETSEACLVGEPQCECGQCTSLLMLTVASAPFPDTDVFCRSVRNLYRNSVSEMDFLQCGYDAIHSTAYNLNQASYLLHGVCDLTLENSECYYNDTVYPHGASLTAIDGCNKCRCINGNVACTKMLCPPDENERCPKIESDEVGICGYTCTSNDRCEGDKICCPTACGGTTCAEPVPIDETKCYYNGESYNRSQTFRSADGCNFCICEDTAITCSNFTCIPPENFTSNATCDLNGVRLCIEDAATFYELNLQSPGFFDVCSEAVNMLRCIEPIIVTCPQYVLGDVRAAISANLDIVRDDCDIDAILQQYNDNTGSGGNLTLDGPCSIDSALQCFNTIPQNDTCQEYQSIVDCVSNYTTGCYSMNMAPVLFTLERKLELLAEDCDLDIPNPGPEPTAAPTPDPNTPSNGYCSYGDWTYSSGSTFRARDGCNFCYCNMGDIMCTELSCPYMGDVPNCNMTAVEECIQDSYMAYIVSMAAQDGGWQICMSAVQMLRCVEPKTTTCPQNVAAQVQSILLYNLNEISSVCNLQQILLAYSQNTSQSGDGLDRQCTMQAAMECLNGQSDSDDICSSQQTSLGCFYDMSQTCFSTDMMSTLRSLKQFFESNSGCQLEMPPGKDSGYCYYGDTKYAVGDNFMGLDGCNFCFCGTGGAVGCTKMYCGDPTLHNDTCDIAGVRQCLQTAALPTLVSMATYETRHICLSAAELLRCVEPKVEACSGDVLQLIRTAVWSDVYLVQPYCDVSQLDTLTNQTMPDTSKPCQLQDAAQCIRIRDGDTACSAYQSMIDCVYKFTAGCLSVDAVPVLYELQKHLEPASRLCNLVVPLMHMDAAYPVAQCTLLFATRLEQSLSLGYLLTGQLEGLCTDVDSYMSCLRTSQLSTLGRMYASNAVQSVSTLLQMCDTYRENQVRDSVECHSCYGAASMEECDAQPTTTCQPNQVCSTGVQLDPSSGVTAVVKGCADMSWCQAVYGCNVQYMSCIHCCTGDLCNAAGNQTMDMSTAAPRTTPTRRPQTTAVPEPESCDLEPVTIFMTAHIVRLVNFNFIPLQQREPICQNFESTISALVDDVECLRSTKAQVLITSQWLTNWTLTVCKQMEDDPIDELKCYESLQCMEKFGNFTNQAASCRMLNATISCLKKNSEYCPESEKISINRSIQLLVDMDHVICVINPLDKHPEPECVDLQKVPKQASPCNETAALKCVNDIQKAINNPFLNQDQFCRLVKLGTQCMKNNTYNCSMEVYNRVAPYAAQVLSLAHQSCPETWCPPSAACQLDKAHTCIDDLEDDVQKAYSQGYVPMQTCLNITRVHHCVMNATEECYAVDRQSVVQRYNFLIQVVVLECRAQAATTQVCYNTFQQGVDLLANFDHLAISNIVETVVQAEIYRKLYGTNGSDFASGVNLPGGYGLGMPGGYSAHPESGSGSRQNPYIRRRRDTHSTNSNENSIFGGGNGTVVTKPGEDFWKDNSTARSDNGTQKGEPGRNSSKSDNSDLPTDRAPEMAQSGMQGGSGMDSELSSMYRLLQTLMNQTEYIDTLITLMGMTRYDIVAMTHPQMLLHVEQHQQQVCDHIREAHSCLQFNLQMIMAPGHEQHLLSTALNLLGGLAMEMCTAQSCYSCRGLDSNELCNFQPVDTCQPLQMCQVKSRKGYISKGCTPVLTCEQECQQAGRNASCYCCNGPMCNKDTDKSAGMCDAQRATGCLQTLLHLAVTGDPGNNATQLHMVGKCLVTSTSGCHSAIYKQINDAGYKMLTLADAMKCSASYDSAFCDLPGAATLTALVSSPYRTVTSVERTCRMFESLVEAFHWSSTTCCERSTNIRLSLLVVYVKIEHFCPGLDLEPVCGELRECRVSSPGGQVVLDMCGLIHLPNLPPGGREGASCNVSMALQACWPDVTLNPNSLCPQSMEEMAAVYQCLDTNTAGCGEEERSQVQAFLPGYIMICPPVYNMNRQQDGGNAQYASVLSCLQPLERVPALLSSSNDLHKDMCNTLETMSTCVRDLEMAPGSLQAPGVIVKLDDLNHIFCSNNKDKDEEKGEYKDEDSADEGCRPEDIVQCLVDPCEVTNTTTACPAFTNAQCVSNYCGDCKAKFMFRGEDITDLCADTSLRSSCDVEAMSVSVAWQLNSAVTYSVQEWQEVEMTCSYESNMEALHEGIAGCHPTYQKPFAALLSWTQGQKDDLCSNHVTSNPCVHPTCDVAMATEILHSLSYHLRTWKVEENVFCQKVSNVWKTLECTLGLCNDTVMAGFQEMMQELRPLSRCPALMQQFYCSEEDQEPVEYGCPVIESDEVGICGFTCLSDDKCEGDKICCTTACGGSACSEPVPIGTTANPQTRRTTPARPTGRTDRPTDAPGTTPSGGQGTRPTGAPRTTPTGVRTQQGPSPTGAPREQGNRQTTGDPKAEQGTRSDCDTEGAKLCLYNVNMPPQNSSVNYCSDLLSSVMQLSDCIGQRTSDCDTPDIEETLMYFSDVLYQYQGSCSINMARQLTRHVEARGCVLPECSYYETHNCIMVLSPSGDTCGNLEDVSACVELVTAGCSPSQRYIHEGMLWSGARSLLPPTCWPQMTSVDISQRPLLQCLAQISQDSTVSQYLKGNTTRGMSGLCEILTDLLTCLEVGSQTPGDPAPLSDALAHMLEHVKPSLNVICSDQSMDEHENEVEYGCPKIESDEIGICAYTCTSNDRCEGDKICCPTACGGSACAEPVPIELPGCDVEIPMAILRTHSVDSLFGAVMPQDGKDYVCSLSTESWRGFYKYLVISCSESRRRDFMAVFNMIEIFGRLTGTCAPDVMMCDPGEAVQCIQDLAQTVKKHEDWETDQEHVCRSIHQTKLCIKQTVSGCEPQVQQSVKKTLEPVMCKAVKICPAQMEVKPDTSQNTTNKLPVCLAPSDLVEDEYTMCNPNMAMDCLTSVAIQTKNTHAHTSCGDYKEALQCFMTQISDCDDLTVMFGLSQALELVANQMEEKCSSRLQAFCDGDRDERGCSPWHLHRCFDVVKEAMEIGQDEQMCFAKEQVQHCLSVHAGSCPRITQLYLKTQLLTRLAKAGDRMDMSVCQSGRQCAYNYITYLQQTFEDLQESAMRRSNVSVECAGDDEMIMSNSYECGVRSDEVSCMTGSAGSLPTDIAKVADASLLYLDTLFDNACAALSGSMDALQDCDQKCLECYSQEIRLQSYLPLLWTFTTEDGMANSTVLYNEEFCSFYMDWSVEVGKVEDAGYCNGSSDWLQDWHQQYVATVDEMYDQYCMRPCNTTQADICIDTLQNYIGNDSCLAYETAQQCLNASIYYCAANVTAFYTQQINTVLINQGYRCYNLPTFTVTTSGSVLEEGVPFAVNVTMATEMADQCIGDECLMEISLIFDDPDFTSCTSGEAIEQILTDRCSVVYQVDVPGVTLSFILYSRLDHKVQPARNITLTLMSRLVEDGEVYTEEPASQLSFSVVNRDTPGLCSLIAEPFITTFDGIEYMNFNKGEFVLYEHTSLPEKVHARFQSCGGALTSCPCGLMVQSGDDVFVLDACRRIGQTSQPLVFRIYRNGEYTPHTKVYYDFNGLSNQFVLPSGTIVFVRSDNGENLDIWIHPSSLDWNSTKGLCGIYDGDINNDFTYPDNTVEPVDEIREWNQALLPFNFIRAWQVDSTLLYGTAAVDGATYRDNMLCRCVDAGGVCEETDLVETCDFITGVDYSGQLVLHEVEEDLARRRKRQAVNEFDETEIDINQLPEWPTASNITEADAAQYCQDTLEAAEYWDICSQITDTSGLVTMCTDRILLSDSYQSVRTTLEMLAVQCRTVILSDPSLTDYLNMTYEVMVPYVFNLTCAQDCSENGQCINGECVCNPGYTRTDCSVMLDLSPSLSSLSQPLYTVESSIGNPTVNQEVEVLGSGFINNINLTCHIQQVQVTSNGYTASGDVSIQPATFLTGDSVRCQMTGSLPLTGLLVSVSNNGRNQSNGLLHIIQDSVCYDCNPVAGICNIKSTSCVIDNKCYAGSQSNPDAPCYICDPFTNVWGYKISASCPDLSSTSSTTTRSTSTTSSTTPGSSSSTVSTASTSSTPSPGSTSSTTSPASTTSTSTTSTTSSTPAATTTSPQPSTGTTAAVTTPRGQGGETDRQDGDDNDDDQTTLIIVISVAGVMVCVVIGVVICIACRLKRGDTSIDETFSTNQSSTDLVKARSGGAHLQGRLNPYFQEVEYATAHGNDQPPIPRRAAPSRSAPFNPEGLVVASPVRAPVDRSAGMYDINMGMFKPEREKGRERQPTHVWEEVGYKIPRPETEAVYDNAGRRSPQKLQYEMGDYTHL